MQRKLQKGAQGWRAIETSARHFKIKYYGEGVKMADFIQFIQTVGFPIAVCVYLLYDRSKSDQLHKEEMDSVKEALNNNTNALTRILEVLHVGSGESN